MATIGNQGSASRSAAQPQRVPSPSIHVDEAIAAAQRYLLDIQQPDGHWCAQLEGDSILESEYILLKVFLGRRDDPKVAKAAERIRRNQRPEGGWGIYPGGPAEVSASVKAYFVLKLLGDDPGSEPMVRARETILSLGGIEACNSFTKIYLAIFGQYDWERCPAVPPEMILLPRQFILSIYEISSWSRTIVVPLSIVWAKRPHFPLPASADIGELYNPEGSARHPRVATNLKELFWETYFKGLDHSLKIAERIPWKPLRQWSLERCQRWIVDRLDRSDGLGAIFPPIINTILALRSLGYSNEHPLVAHQIGELERLEIEDDETLKVQPCFSPVWDTSLALTALLSSGISPQDPAVLEAARWLMRKEVRESGDWQVRMPSTPPGGWYFEYANEFYPDCDDTAEVLGVLARVRFPDAEEDRRRIDATERGLSWLLAMQNRDGGWAAFDRNCDREFLTFVPFADHNAMLDPSCEDITGRCLGALHALGFDPDHPGMRRAMTFLYDKQHADGTWYGRWGCNYIYGTWLALYGLRTVGVDVETAEIQRAAAWIRERQNGDGGWGELPLSYDDPATKGCGPSTAAQTAWALMALFHAGDFDSEAVGRGVRFLLEQQRDDGTWLDESWTGTGFPSVFYLNYHLYAVYFPLLALALYRGGPEEPAWAQSPATA